MFDDILIVTKGEKSENKKELERVLTKLQNEVFKLRESKSEFFKNAIEWLGHKINQIGIKPIGDKLEAILKLHEPRNEKEQKSLLWAMLFLSKYIENLSSNTDELRKLLKKDKDWEWTEEHKEAFITLKHLLTEIPCLAHYNSEYPNIVTTDASTQGLEVTL